MGQMSHLSIPGISLQLKLLFRSLFPSPGSEHSQLCGVGGQGVKKGKRKLEPCGVVLRKCHMLF